MRRLRRPALPAHSIKYFQRWTTNISKQPTSQAQVDEAHRLWEQSRTTKAVDEAVEKLREMNDDLKTCMYCEHDTAAQEKNGEWRAIIDHWEPIAEAPKRAFDWENHVLACHRCNSFLKEAEFPRDATTGAPMLLQPGVDDPPSEITFSPSTGEFIHRSARAGATLRMFQLSEFAQSRQDMWRLLLLDLAKYDAAIQRGDPAQAAEIKQKILQRDHRSLLTYLDKIAASPAGTHLLPAKILAIVSAYNPGGWTNR